MSHFLPKLSREKPAIFKALKKILLFLSPIQIENLAKTCRRFNSIVNKEKFWMEEYDKRWPESGFFRFSSHSVRNTFLLRRMLEDTYLKGRIRTNKHFTQTETNILVRQTDAPEHSRNDLQRIIKLSRIKKLEKQKENFIKSNQVIPTPPSKTQNEHIKKQIKVTPIPESSLGDDSEPKVEELIKLHDLSFKEYEETERFLMSEVANVEKTFSDVFSSSEYRPVVHQNKRRSLKGVTGVPSPSIKGVVKPTNSLANSPPRAAKITPFQRSSGIRNSAGGIKGIQKQATTPYGSNPWERHGYHISNIRMEDDMVLLNCRLNFRNRKEPWSKSYSYELLYFPIRLSKSKRRDILWANKVLDVSSEMTDGYQAKNILGPPRVYPLYGFRKGTFCPKKHPLIAKDEYVVLEFPYERFVSDVYIYETFSPGYIYRISFQHPGDKKFYIVWTDPRVVREKKRVRNSKKDSKIILKDKNFRARSRIFSPQIAKLKFRTRVIKIDFFSSVHKFCIDGVKIRGRVKMSESIGSGNELFRASPVHPKGGRKNGQGKENITQKKEGNININNNKEELPNSPVLETEHLGLTWKETLADVYSKRHNVRCIEYDHYSFAPYDFGRSRYFGEIYAITSMDSSGKQMVSVIREDINSMMNNVNVSGDREVLLECPYSLDQVIMVKLFVDKTLLIVSRMYSEIQKEYQVSIWNIEEKKLKTVFQVKHESDNREDDKEIQHIRCSREIILFCSSHQIMIYQRRNPIKLMKMKSLSPWKQKKAGIVNTNFKISCVDINDDLGNISDHFVFGSADKFLYCYDFHNGKSRKNILQKKKKGVRMRWKVEHETSLCDCKLIAAGSLVSSCVVGDSKIRIFSSITGEKLRTIVVTPSISYLSEKEVMFYNKWFLFHQKGSNEFTIGEFKTEDYFSFQLFDKYYGIQNSNIDNNSCNIL